jgi:hypothetical protein
VPNDHQTIELPVVDQGAPHQAAPGDAAADGAAQGPGPSASSPDSVIRSRDPLGDLPEIDDAEWLSAGPARGMRLRVPTAIVVALLVAALAFWGGALIERHHSTSTAVGATVGSGASGAARRAAGSAPSGAGGVASGATNATQGTVTAAKGDILSITDISGKQITVTITATTTVTRTGKGSVGVASVGDTATIVGTSAANGAIAATTVTLTGKGITSTGTGGGVGGGLPTTAASPSSTFGS